MTEPRPFASLSPSLLARKGAARPAMRPQIQPLHQFHEATARQIEDDLGWNDMGHDVSGEAVAPSPSLAEVVSIAPVPAPEAAPLPEVVRQQAEVEARMTRQAPAATPAGNRRSALADGRRAAFTLRLDAERHLKLRLASTIASRSAQQLVTDALDQFLASLPGVDSLAEQVRKRR